MSDINANCVTVAVDVHPLDVIVRDHQLEEWLDVRLRLCAIWFFSVCGVDI